MTVVQTQLSKDFDELLEYGKKDLSFQGRHRVLASKRSAESLIARGDIAEGYYALGLVNAYLNNVKEAAECFKRVYNLNSNDSNCFNYMNSLLENGDIQEAFDIAKKFIRTNPNNKKIFLHALDSAVFHFLPGYIEEIDSLFKGERTEEVTVKISDCKNSLNLKKDLLKKYDVDERFYQLVSIISNQVIKDFVVSPTYSRIFESPDKQSLIQEFLVSYLDEDECNEISEIFDDKIKQYLIDNFSDNYDFMSNIFNLCVVFTSDIGNKKFYQVKQI